MKSAGIGDIGTHMWGNRLHKPCLLGGPQRGDKNGRPWTGGRKPFGGGGGVLNKKHVFLKDSPVDGPLNLWIVWWGGGGQKQ